MTAQPSEVHRPQSTVQDDTGPLVEVAKLVRDNGIRARGLRQVIALLTEGPRSLDELVRTCAVPRRSVEDLLQAAGPDLEQRPTGARLRTDRIAAYREQFGYAQLRATELADPLAARLAASTELVAAMERHIAAAPRAVQALDHVSATAETVVRRALWLDSTFDLSGARLLCVGDHDLTSLAACAVNPDLDVIVVDLDERVLEFIDRTARAQGYRISCRYADFRFGLPESATGWADLVLTDPPYTPEGVQLFLGRSLQGLRDREHGRVVLAYGYSDRHPALGLRVQRATQDLDLAFEAILPAFNRYRGAQAVGSASDLYVCQPTAQSWAGLDRKLSHAAVQVYTHGAQSLEGDTAGPDEQVADQLAAAAAGPQDQPVTLFAGSRGKDRGAGAQSVTLGTLFESGVPTAAARRGPVVAAVELTDDPGAWLLRILLAVNAERMAVLVPNNHPDLASEAAQRGLTELTESKYTLRLRRSTPGPRYAVVEAVAVQAEGQDPGTRLVRRLLERATGKVENAWREGLIQLSGGTLTKNEARAQVRASAPDPDLLQARLVDLPRHQLAQLLPAVAASAG